MADLDKTYDEAVALKDNGELVGAVAKLNEILAVEADHVLAHSAMAVYLQRMGREDESQQTELWKQALEHAQKVADLAPTDPFSFTQLSVINQRCGKIQEAEDAMEQARQIQAAQ